MVVVLVSVVMHLLSSSLVLQHPRDSEEKVRARVEQYQQFLDDLLDYYETGQHVNADQDPQMVFESVESILVNPLPKRM